MEEMTRQAVNLVILQLVRDNKLRTLVTPNGKTVIGKMGRDGRLVNEQGVTLAYLNTNGRLLDATTGALYKVKLKSYKL